MTVRERFLATLSGQRPDQILYSAGFTPDLHRRMIEHAGTEDLAGHYGLFSPVGVGPKEPQGWKAPDYTVYYTKQELAEIKLDSMGVGMKPSGFYHFWGYISPLRNAEKFEQLESYPVPDLSNFTTDHMAARVAQTKAAGSVSNCWVGHMYESSWQIRGYEAFLLDMIERPEWAECILDKLFRRNMVIVEAACRAGVDYITCGDDVANQNAMMFSLPMWRRFMLSRWSKVWAMARSIKPDIHIWYHSDGNITDIIPELAEAGVTIFNPVQPECLDPAVLRKQYPQMNMDGTIGTQSTLPFGTPEKVRQTVLERVRTCGDKGRLILGPTHVLEPDVPIANFEAYVKAAREAYTLV